MNKLVLVALLATATFGAGLDAGAGWLMLEESFTCGNLAARLDSLLGLPAILEKAAECAKAAGTHEASEQLADMVCTLLPSNGADGPGTERRAA